MASRLAQEISTDSRETVPPAGRILPGGPDLDPGLALRAEQACNRFEQAWKLSAEKGETPRLEEFLDESPEEDRPVLLGELLAIEVRYRVQAGETPTPEDYHERFPDQPKIVKAAFQRSTTISWRVGEKSSQPPVPETVPGYEILEELGRGGMGVVYKARQIGLKRLVALKMILSGSYAGAEELARFRTEAEAVARLQHPNIVQIYEIGEHKGLPFFSLEYVDGGSLAGKVRGTPWTVNAAAKLVQTLASAMQAAHEHDIIHRDLKPANVLLSVVRGPSSAVKKHNGAGNGPLTMNDGLIPKIADFGLAKKLEEAGQTQSGAVMGTPSYMAPEQAEGKKDIGPLADVYALGAILYECLTGRPPFKGPTAVETILQVLADEPVPPSRLRPRLPRDVETICLKCLQKQPHKRYASAQELAEDLRRFQAGEPIRARPVGAVERSWRWCRRNPYLATAGGLAGAAVVAALVLLSLYARQQEQAANRLAKEQEQTKDALRSSNANLALLMLDRALTLGEKGELGDGVGDPRKAFLWLTRALQTAPADDERLQHVIRANLGGWRRDLSELKSQLDLPLPNCVTALSCDGKRLAAGARTDKESPHFGHVAIWDLATGAQLGPPMTHQDNISTVAFHPDGGTLVSASDDGQVRFWDTRTNKALREPLVHPDRVASVAFSPDGRTLVTGCDDGKLRFWEAFTGAAQGEPVDAGRAVAQVVYHLGGKWVAAACLDQRTWTSHAQLWDAATRLPVGPRLEHRSGINGLAFTPDGSRLVLAGTGDSHIWEVSPLRWLGYIGQGWHASSVAVSTDNRICALVGPNRSIRFWDLTLRKPIGLPIWLNYNATVHFTHDSQSLLTKTPRDCLQEWQTPSLGFQTLSFPHVLPSANKAFVNSFAGIRDGLRCLAASPDGKQLLAGDWDGAARTWDLASGQPRLLLTGHKGLVLTACYSRDGRTILTGSADQTARLWDATTGKPIGEPWQLEGPVITAALSPDGQGAFTGTFFSSQKAYTSGVYWNVAAGRRRGPPLKVYGTVTAADFTPDGQSLWLGSWITLEQWSVESPTRAQREIASHSSAVSSLAISPDGRTIVSGSNDRTARLWNAATGLPLGPPLVHQGPVQQVSFSPDGRLVATASQDGTARLWDVATGKAVGPPLFHPRGAHAAVFSRDGQYLTTRGEEPLVYRWRLTKPVPGDVEHIVLWAQVLTGMELDADGAVHTLDIDDWRKRRQQLEALGGSPAPAAEASLGD